MTRLSLFIVSLVIIFGLSYSQYNLEWSSGNIGQYGWGGAYAFDIDNDNLVEFEVRRSGQFTFYNGNYTVAWAISFPGYDYLNVAHPRDINGDGLLVPLNTDSDPAGELVIAGYYFSGSTYYGRFRVYDGSTHNLEFESPLITGFYGSITVEDIDGDNRDEIIINRFGSATTETYVDVYAYVANIGEDKKLYKVQSPFEPHPNPSAGQLIIPFSVTHAESFSQVKVCVYDEIGREIKVLMNAVRAAPGEYKLIWDGCDQQGRSVPSGTYFVHIIRGTKQETKSIRYVRE